jgi:hypothetical protein
MAFILLLLLNRELKLLTKQAAMVSEAFPSTGFADYDLLPEQLKKRMEELVKNDTTHQYSFYYFFETDDINRHYYLDDQGLQIVVKMPVTNEEALNRIDEKLNEIEVKKLGRYVVRDTTNYQKYRQGLKVVPVPKYRFFIFHVLPEGAPDFTQLRVAIMKDTVNRGLSKYPENIDTVMYDLDEVDVPPRPLRGLDYFQEAVRKEAQLEEVFALFDTGTVTVEFAVMGHHAQALDVVDGLNNWNNSYEAYQADSEFMKAVHNAKVRWKPGIKNGQPVKTKMKITFKIDSAKVSSAVHQLSSI